MRLSYLILFFGLYCPTIFAQYCSPIISGPPPTLPVGITFVGLNTINSLSNAITGYSDSSQIITTLVKGKSYQLKASWPFGNAQNFASWIDYNIDEIFTSNELVYAINNPVPAFFFPVINTNFTIPINAKTDTARLRIASNDTSNLSLNAASCTEMLRGEVEDYSIILKDTQYVNSIQPYWGSVAQGETNKLIFGIEIIFTDESLTPTDLTVQNILFKTTGSTNPNNDILNAKLWYTDTINQFQCHPNPQLLGTITNPNDNLNFPITQVIFSAKRNYFWLTYDISSLASISNLIDATLEEVQVAGNPYLPDSVSRMPFRRIDNRISYPNNKANIWMFDKKMGIDFNWANPDFISYANPDFACSPSEGLGSLCNADGNLLFYIDACDIYDKCHQIMPNGTGIIGLSAHTEGISIQKPGKDSIFYIFTFMTADNPSNPLAGEASLLYSIVDMKLNSNKGAVIQKNLTLLDSVLHEMLAIVNHCNGIDKWIITGIWSKNEYHAFLLTESGIQAAIKSSPVNGLIFDDGFMFSSRGTLKTSPDGTKLAAVMQHMASNSQLFDFDNATGIVSNALSLHPDDDGMALTFSPNSSKLYIGQESGGRVFQYDLCANNILASRKEIGQAPAFSIHFLQNGPDGKIYFPGGSSRNYLSIIENPDSTNPNFINDGFWLGGYTKNSSLIFTSGFNESYFNTNKHINSGFTYTYGCDDSIIFTDTTFYPTYCNQKTKNWLWNFGDDGTSTQQNPNHVYDNEGTYTITLIINQGCQYDTISKNITITSVLQDSLPFSDTTICRGDQIILSAFEADFIIWSPNVDIDDNTLPKPLVNPKVTTTYRVIGSNITCEDLDTAYLNVSVKNCAVFVPNAFSPNGDGFNDKLLIRFDGIINDYILKIYDRWGNLVFRTNNPLESWKGDNITGHDVSSGTFVYLLSINKEILNKGNITLVR